MGRSDLHCRFFVLLPLFFTDGSFNHHYSNYMFVSFAQERTSLAGAKEHVKKWEQLFIIIIVPFYQIFCQSWVGYP